MADNRTKACGDGTPMGIAFGTLKVLEDASKESPIALAKTCIDLVSGCSPDTLLYLASEAISFSKKDLNEPPPCVKGFDEFLKNITREQMSDALKLLAASTNDDK